MRLRRLDLVRFGRFTNHSLDFGEKPAGRPDLHVVYGPNESGKSTALAAFLDLLYGIGGQSRFNFLHPYETMRIGAALELAGGVQQVVRIKKPQNSLFDGGDRPLPEGILLAALAGIDRAAYRTMFSLDDETLEAGGESILASKGDLGQLLFSASAGLADLSRRLAELRAEADGFYKKHARRGELADLKIRLAELKAEREQIDTLASHYAQLIAERDRAAAQYDEAIGLRGQIQARVDEIQRHLHAVPRLGALRAIRARLLPLAELPAAPVGWAEELPELQRQDVELETGAKAIDEEIARLSSERDAIMVDETAAGLADRVERLGDLRARYVTAAKDIPERRLQVRAAETLIAGILRRIERQAEPDPSQLVLGASVVGALRSLIEARSGIETALASAAAEASKARGRLEEAADRLKAAGEHLDAGGDPETRIASIRSLVAELRADDHPARRRLAARSRQQHAGSLEERIRALRPWTGDIQHLVEMTVPDPDAMKSWTTAEDEARKRLDRHEGEVERLATQAIRVKGELEAIGSVAGVVSDRDAAAIRTARERAWALHRRTLDASSADAFESALRHDDLVTGARLQHAAEVERLHQAAQAHAALQAEIGRAQELRDAAAAALRRVRDEIADALRATIPALPGDMPPSQLEAWLGRRDMALAVRTAMLAAERDLREAEADAASARNRLATALLAASIPHRPDDGFDALLAAAQAAIDREAKLKVLRDAVEECRRDLRTREGDVERASAADRTWSESWAAACSECWLGQGGRTPPLATVREIIAAVAELGTEIDKQAVLADRIDKMEKDQAAFAVEVRAIAQVLSLSETPGDVLDLDQAVKDRVEEAKAARSEREDTARRLGIEQERRRALSETRAVHAMRKAQMTAFFGVGSLGDVADKLRDAVKKAELEEEADNVAREIAAALRVPTVAEAEQVLDVADRAALETELSEQKARYDDQDQRSRDLFSAHSKAADQVDAVAGDDAVAAIEQRRRTTLLDLEDGSLRYLRLRIGAMAAEQALRVYRDRHRSSMMARASEAFCTISRGAYTGLATQPEKDGEILVAIGADGSSKEATELSKGTRFQLYLALRVAGYHEFARSRPPVPFIADDIMETFDDFRAEEAFRLLGEMAKLGQVIYFTHHRHLCEIARHVSPGAMVHDLTVRVHHS